MNFTSPSDFQYVTGANIDATHPCGDMNRIEIDNDIMPVRATEYKRKLRGIDIAFLMEATEELARASNLLEGDVPSQETFEFSRCVKSLQIENIINRLVATKTQFEIEGKRVGAYISSPLLMIADEDYDFTEQVKVASDGRQGGQEYTFPITEIIPCRVLIGENEAPTIEKEISQGDIETLFGILKKSHSMLAGVSGYNQYGETIPHTNTLVQGHSTSSKTSYYIDNLFSGTYGCVVYANYQSWVISQSGNYCEQYEGRRTSQVKCKIDFDSLHYNDGKVKIADGTALVVLSIAKSNTNLRVLHYMTRKVKYSVGSDGFVYLDEEDMETARTAAEAYKPSYAETPNQYVEFSVIVRNVILPCSISDRVNWDVEEDAE